MRRAILLAVLVTLAAVPGARAEQWGLWNSPGDLVVSPDGRNVYAGGSFTLSFSVDEATGGLSLIGHTEPGGYLPQMAISPDGRFVYVGRGHPIPAGAIHVLARDAASGLVTHDHNFLGTDGSAAIGGIDDLEASPDGRHVYTVERNPDLIGIHDRDPDTGALSARRTLRTSAGTADLAVAPDGRHVYAVGHDVRVLARDATSGALSESGSPTSSSTGYGVAVSPDGSQVHANTIMGVDGWRRDPQTGALTHLGRATPPDQGCQQCDYGRTIAAAPDGRSVFAAARAEALLEFTTGESGPSFHRRYANGADGVQGLGQPRAMAWSPDGRMAYVVSGVVGAFDSGVTAFRRTPAGLDFAAAFGPAFEVPNAPPRHQPPAVTINGGAIYTNDPNVEVTVTNDGPTSSVRLANTADFSSSPPKRITASEQTYAWTLATSGPERSVKHVHVRFTPLAGQAVELFDDIVLDESRPEIVSARIAGSRLRMKARDNRSGVRRMQVTTSRSKPGRVRAYSRTPKVGRKARKVYVRVFDGAGNPSRWKAARRP